MTTGLESITVTDNKMRTAFALSLTVAASSAFAWDGYDYNQGTNVQIEKGQLVRPGKEIEVYDYRRGYINVEVESIRSSGASVEVEVTDRQTGETRTFDMDRD